MRRGDRAVPDARLHPSRLPFPGQGPGARDEALRGGGPSAAPKARLKEDLLATARVGHLATASRDGRPHVVPVCFAWLPPYVYSAIDGKPKRTTLLRRVRHINETGLASLVVDRCTEDWKSLSYLLVDG